LLALAFALVPGGCPADPRVEPAKAVSAEVGSMPSATTRATSPVPVSSVAWGEPVNGLRLGIALDSTTLVTHLENVGSEPLVVWTHALPPEGARERQSQWLIVTVRPASGAERWLHFSDDAMAEPVSATLAAGAELVERWDLAAWSARAVNRAQGFGKDVSAVRAKYLVPAMPTTAPPPLGYVSPWNGEIQSGWVSVAR
jgi:hypothetical protein